MKEPIVSVIVPNYNHPVYLEKRIESILQQTYSCYELILLDDCSSDNSRNILLQYKDDPRVSHIVFNEKTQKALFVNGIKGSN